MQNYQAAIGSLQFPDVTHSRHHGAGSDKSLLALFPDQNYYIAL
tara:strand:+ start:1209 stop:1340 length:132 start_codon:yes stop_codon:yes gene_type:complete